MIALATPALRPQPGIEAERQADDSAARVAPKASSSVAGMRCRISFSAGSLKTKERPRSPRSALPRKTQVLLPQRQVEAERGDGPRPLDLVGLGADQDLDRVADGVDAQEDQQRHHQHHGRRLEQPAEQEDLISRPAG